MGKDAEQLEEARQATDSNLAEDEEVDEGSVPAPKLQADVVLVVLELPTRRIIPRSSIA